ncbi:unnamed protein product [Symbiodinium sp. CCMP2592]|nr:unnamed protein product [Symbiodinium sp. CCMP2592]
MASPASPGQLEAGQGDATMSMQEAVQQMPAAPVTEPAPQVSVNDVTQLAALVQAASSAAASAASAVSRMQEQNERGTERQYSGYTDAAKVLKYPEGFGGGDSHEADLARWQEFAHSFRSWILYAEPAFETELDMIEKHPDVVITLGEMARATGVRARRLYAILSGLLKGRPLVMLRAVEEHNGFELWRQLISVYAPRTRARSLALLSAYMAYPAFVKERSIREQVSALERISEEYQKDDADDDCGLSSISLEDQYDCLEAINEMYLGRGPQVRAITHDEVDIILDSGADVSALPLRFSNVGVKDRSSSGMRYSDAQGNPLQVREFRIAEVRIGPCRFYERFALSNVTHPLICLGKLYRAGWFVRPESNVLKLSNDTHSVPIGYRHQSFCAQGTIRMLSRSETDAMMSQSTSAMPRSIAPQSSHMPRSSSTQSGHMPQSSSTQSGHMLQSSSTQSGHMPQSSSTQSGHMPRGDGASSSSGADGTCVQQGSVPLQVRAIEVTLGEKLSGLSNNRGWVKIAPSCYVLRSSAAHHVNTTLGPFDNLMWRRTTLCRRSDRWYLEEFGEDVSALAGEGNLEKPFDPGEPVQSCITFAYNRADMSPEELGFSYAGDNYGVILPAPAPAAAASADDDMDLSPPEVPVAPPAPAADGSPGEANPVPDSPEGQLPADTVVIEGVRVTSESSATVLRAACTSLGLSKAGNRRQLWRRLTNHINSQQLLIDKHVEANLASSRARDPVTPAVASEPDAATKARHCLTHEPYEPWCEICIRHRARQDQHATSVPHTSSENAVVSFDFGFLSRKGQSLLSTKPEVGEDSLTVLFCVDRASKAVFAIPTQSKAGAATSFLVTEAARFICWLGHSNVKLKSDNERPILHVMHHLQRALRSLNIGVTSETSPVGSHESNGEVEQALQRVRQHACVLISQLEEGAGMTKEVIKVGHPLFQWSVLHACWLLNRFRVLQNETAFERVRSSSYEGRICLFGERVMGFLQTAKASAQWIKGVWLGKTCRNDVHIIGTAAGIFVTRSVRRFANPWDLDLAVSVEKCVWEHGLASLGSQLVLAKRVAPPAPIPVPVPAEVSGGPVIAPGDGDGKEAADEGAASPSEVAGTDPSSSSSSSSRRSSDVAMSIGDSFMSVADEGAGVGYVDNGEPGPGGDVNRVQLSAASLVCPFFFPGESIRAVHAYGHEDESPELCFEPELVEGFEEDDLQDDEWEEPEEVDLTDYEQKLMFPRSGDDPPSLSQDKLDEIDLVAEFVEIERLKKLSVLLDPSTLDGHSAGEVKRLTTRMVKDWREKVHQGKPIWLRRARYVAREFAWLCERSDTFAPASSCLLNRLLPILYTTSTAPDKCLVAIDVSDAFLTVDQTVPTEVVYRPTGGGPEVKFALGKLLPGQRDGSEKWYGSFLQHLSSSLSVESCEAYPTLLRTKGLESVMQLRVDDMLAFTTLKYANNELKPALLAKYKIKFEVLQKPGDVLWFLKRKLHLVSEDQLLMSPRPKYLERLQRLLNIRPEAKKKTPLFSDLEKLDGAKPLSPADAKLFRCCVGVLLYVAHDCIDCQYSINMLASRMSSPTELSIVWAVCSLFEGTWSQQDTGFQISRMAAVAMDGPVEEEWADFATAFLREMREKSSASSQGDEGQSFIMPFEDEDVDPGVPLLPSDDDSWWVQKLKDHTRDWDPRGGSSKSHVSVLSACTGAFVEGVAFKELGIPFQTTSISEPCAEYRSFTLHNHSGIFHAHETIRKQIQGCACTRHPHSEACVVDSSPAFACLGTPCKPFSVQRAKRFKTSPQDHSAYAITFTDAVDFFETFTPVTACFENVEGFDMPDRSQKDGCDDTPMERFLAELKTASVPVGYFHAVVHLDMADWLTIARKRTLAGGGSLVIVILLCAHVADLLHWTGWKGLEMARAEFEDVRRGPLKLKPKLIAPSGPSSILGQLGHYAISSRI